MVPPGDPCSTSPPFPPNPQYCKVSFKGANPQTTCCGIVGGNEAAAPAAASYKSAGHLKKKRFKAEQTIITTS